MQAPSKSGKKTAGGERQPFFVGQQLDVHIDSLSYGGGHGVARVNGFVIFVPLAAPDEKARVQLTQVKKNYAWAELINVVEASPHRRQPPCPVAQQCGGCSWQHISYEEQLRQKQKILQSFAAKISRSEILLVRGVIAAPNEFRYRNRIQVHRRGDKMGFFEKGSHNIVDIEDCLIAEEELTSCFESLRSEDKYASANKAVKIEIARELGGAIRLDMGERSPVAALFSQVNTIQNERLQAVVTEEVVSGTPGLIYDLYAGAGNLTFPLAEAQRNIKIIGVELSGESVKRAKEQMRHLGLNNASFVAQDVSEFLAQQTEHNALTVVLDPPRPGCSKQVISELGRLKPSKIVYVSCHLPTLIRDLNSLLALDEHLKVTYLQGLDMFPQTDYLETVCVLQRV